MESGLFESLVLPNLVWSHMVWSDVGLSDLLDKIMQVLHLCVPKFIKKGQYIEGRYHDMFVH